jgi:methionyl-tRNA formyltransferase
MRAVFYGTPATSVPILAALASVAEVKLVVSRPDAPRKRSGKPVSPPVAEAARSWGMRLVQPVRPEDELVLVSSLGVDVAVVAAYAHKIPPDLLAVPAQGFVNVHLSLLPRWRGASPVTRAILAGDSITGVTLMKLDEGLDTGPIVVQESLRIGSEETAGELTARLAHLGGRLLAEHLPSYAAGSLALSPQAGEGVTEAGKVKVEEAFVDPVALPAPAVLRMMRAFNPSPGAWTTLGQGRLKLWRGRVWEGTLPEPGCVEMADDRVVVGTRDGGVELLEVQPAGKPRMGAADWMRGRRGEPARLG